MPGTPMNPENSELNKLQNVEPKDAQQNEQNEPVIRELTLTDVLNKHLLVSFLERINKSIELSDSEETQTEKKDKDQIDSDF